MWGKANCCCPARAQPSVPHPGNGRVVRQWLLSPPLRRGRTSTTRVRSAVDVVICSVSGSLAQLALAPLPTLPPTAWSSWGPALAGPQGFEWGSTGAGWDPPVSAEAATIRRCGAGTQVAAVVGAEAVAVGGGCLRRRDRRRHLRSGLRPFGLDGLSSPLVWERG
jgi:hypothetical protein